MQPTLQPGQLVLVKRYSPSIRPPSRGDVVAARPAMLRGRAIVKRLVGLPRDVVQVDGTMKRLEDDQFFLVGDQRDESLDSRTFGPVIGEELMGRVEARLSLWPPRYVTMRS